MKHNLGITDMNRKLFLLACTFGIFTLAGCAAFNSQHDGNCPAGSNCDTNAYMSKSVAPSPCDDNYLDAACQDQFTNYTQVAADYRQYGERNPRDIRVSQAAAGNNMTAVIPPSIENEVIEYEINADKTVAPAPAETCKEPEKTAPKSTLKDTLKKEAPTENTTEITVESYENIVEQPDQGVVEEEYIMEEDLIEDWIAEEGQNLKSLLSEWSDRAGWRLVWDTNRNYTLTAGAMFRGTFADVASALIRAFARARPAPIATFYKGNRVLVVETMEDENAYN